MPSCPDPYRSKRALDLAGALLLLALTWPLLVVAAVAIRLDSRGPVLFRQTRLGRGGRLFSILKLRTLVPGPPDASTTLLPDDPRITRVGRFLRAHRVDELPQLFNVLRGDMSLVGPRPLLPEFLPWYAAEDLRRMEVLPGVTGWHQVKGSARHTWPERVRLDVWYVDHASLLLDLRILLATFGVVLRAEQAEAPDGPQDEDLPERYPVREP